MIEEKETQQENEVNAKEHVTDLQLNMIEEKETQQENEVNAKETENV